ncbi:reticulocalbin-2-like [Limulus polyphemus]|uniref:Reticulocalbin-2-like n=1 Tax=Limulus polyphemus TaxID=6850 RepID=A0ABM1BVB1_LIMPO|nr:reticulocalbin-2-like [Limulus polyphemus]
MITLSHIIYVSVLFTHLCIEVGHTSPHSHVRPKGQILNREREENGAFSSRDYDHYKEGVHHSEFDHEAVIGNRHDAEEYDHLSPEESKKRLGILVQKMDKDGDGFVDKKELTKWILRSFKMLTEEEGEERLEEEDENEDGKVTWEEHMAEAFGIDPEDDDEDEIPDPLEAAEEHQMMQEDRALFKAADLNGDGILDKSEFSAFANPEEFVHMHQVLYEQTMVKRDKNKDGYLSLEEFLSDGSGKPPAVGSESYLVEKDHFENEYDVNHDGKLEKAEVLKWLLPDNDEVAENEAVHLIKESDDDKDGKLSIQEILDHHDTFVGSEATDFGEHLYNTHKFNDEL